MLWGWSLIILDYNQYVEEIQQFQKEFIHIFIDLFMKQYI